MSLGDQTSEVALEFDDAVHAPLEATPGDVASAVALQAENPPPHRPEVTSQLARTPHGLEPGEPTSHLQGKGGGVEIIKLPFHVYH